MTNPIDDPTASPAVKGEKDIGGSTQDPETDDDINVMIEDVLGKQPKPGQTFNDLINEAEKNRG